MYEVNECVYVYLDLLGELLLFYVEGLLYIFVHCILTHIWIANSWMLSRILISFDTYWWLIRRHQIKIRYVIPQTIIYWINCFLWTWYLFDLTQIRSIVLLYCTWECFSFWCMYMYSKLPGDMGYMYVVL